MRTLWACACAAALAAVATVTTATATAPPTTGRIEGVVKLVAAIDAPIPSGAYPSRRVTRPSPKASEINNVVVFVKDGPRSFTLQTMKAEMRQEGEDFVPRLVAITRGSSVEFPNAIRFSTTSSRYRAARHSTSGATLAATAARARSPSRGSSRSTAICTRR